MATDKFQCHYRILLNWIDDNGNAKQEIVTDPVTVEFNVTKTTQSQNTSRINIYNLHAATRESIYQDKILLREKETLKWLTLEAGYCKDDSYLKNGLPLVTWGYIQECHSYRSGVDFITTIDVTDPDILTEYCGVTFEAGTTYKQAYEYLVGRLSSLQIGETGILEGTFEVPTVFDGNAFVLVNKLTGGHTFVDNGVVNTLGDNETLSDYGCYLVAADTGLLETPKRYDHILEISMLFEPTIKVGQLIDLRSSTQGRFDGQYKVLGINHNCVISGSDGGSRTTTLQLQFIDTLPNTNENITSNPEGYPASTVKNGKIEPINVKVGSDARAIYEYIKKHNGNLPPDRKMITPRISWKEMIYPTGTDNKPADVKKHITPAILQNCINIAEKLTAYANTKFPSNKININSGYRTPENKYNRRKEGKLLASNHLNGSAIDFTVGGFTLAKLKSLFQKPYWQYGAGLHYGWGVHISLNPKERF